MKTRGKKKSEDMALEDVVPEGELFVISTKPSEVEENEDVEPEVKESQGMVLKENVIRSYDRKIQYVWLFNSIFLLKAKGKSQKCHKTLEILQIRMQQMRAKRRWRGR